MKIKELTYLSMVFSYFIVFKFIGGFMPLWNVVYALLLSHVIVALFIHYAGKQIRKIILFNLMINISLLYKVSVQLLTMISSFESFTYVPSSVKILWFLFLCYIYFTDHWRRPLYFEKKMNKAGIFDKIDKAVANLQ